MTQWVRRVVAAWDRFLFESCDPRVVPVIRIGFAVLILIQTWVAWVDADFWFTDSGVLRSETAQQITGPSGWSLLYLFPSTIAAVQYGLIVLWLHATLLLLGWWSRIQAAAIFVWLVSFQNRNPMIIDGEDTVMRLFAFMMIWLPLDPYWSIRRSREVASRSSPDFASAWALRLIQIEMTAIYASTVICKMYGETWQNGTAVWHVSRMTDYFGRWVPSTLFDIHWVSSAATWGTLLIEAFLPIGLWLRPTRKYAILAGAALHLGIEFSMNLFLFQWIMLLGLVAFVVPSEWTLRWRPKHP